MLLGILNLSDEDCMVMVSNMGVRDTGCMLYNSLPSYTSLMEEVNNFITNNNVVISDIQYSSTICKI